MKYTVDAGNLLRVEFPNFPLPNDPYIAKLFPRRKAFFSMDGKWIGVVCSLDEWKLFLDAMQGKFETMPNAGNALSIIVQFREEFVEFLAATAHGPFRVGDDRPVA